MEVLPYLGIIALAFATESLTEHYAGPLLALLTAKWPKLQELRPAQYVAAAVGLGLAFAFRLNIVSQAFGFVGAEWVGMVVTGAMMGRGANYIHDFVTRYLVKPELPY
ncbi:hypothetical protein CMI37_25465 [Candidatus Pacearchaeota archaeon]|nr:hypothetical protein [Candidatus Pacearchaeota archaeon]